MKIFIDFDDVLFNTKQFVLDLKKIFKDNGVSDEVFEKTYKDKSIIGDERVRKYNPREQIRRIKKLGFETGMIENDMADFLENTGKYIFKDSKKFLEKLKKEDLYIVSFGDGKYQREKIVNSGIGHYFEKIIVTDVSKAVGIRKILKNKKTEIGEALIFLDDRVKFLDDIKKSYPGMLTFLVQRKDGRFFDEPKRCCEFVVQNFSEALKIMGNGR